MKRHALSALLLGLGALGLAPSAHGQYQTDMQNPMDRNPQLGSGGMNARRPNIDYSLRNNIITGNVTGLGYFRDEVDYKAPFEFDDETSSDDLFRFRADSLAPTPPSSGRVHGPHIREPFRGGSYHGAFSDVPGQRNLRGGAITDQDIISYREGSEIWEGYRPRGAFQGPSIDVPGRMSGTLHSQRLPDGRTLEMTGSPLLGLRSTLYDPTANLGLNEVLANEGEEEGSAPAVVTPPGMVVPEQVQPFEPNAASVPQTEQIAGYSPMGSPTLDLGAYTEPSGWSDLMQSGTPEQQAQRIEQHIFRPLGMQSYQPGEDPYLDLLTQVRAGGATDGQGTTDVLPGMLPADDEQAAAAEAEGEAEDEGEGEAEAPAEPTQPEVPTTLTPVLPQGFELMMPTPELVQEARAQRDLAMQAARPLPPDVQTFDPNQPLPNLVDPNAPVEGEEVEDTSAVERVLGTLNYDLPRLESFAGQQRTRLNEYLRQAEQDMAEGKYFDAEENYRLVLIAQPGHPMARVGRIHAFIGAGMMDSAAKQLRSLLEDHPELIATRYDAKLLPAPERLRWAVEQLQSMLRSSKSSASGILLAYMGYQLEQRPLVEYGLDLAQARDPLDPLNTVLRRIWLDEKRQSDSQDAPR